MRRFAVRIIRTIPHNPHNFTQGLVFDQGLLYESTGLKGRSTLQCIDARDGGLIRKREVRDVFAEGLTLWGDHLIQLTWKAGKAFVYRRDNFKRIRTFTYQTQGWGLTADDTHLIMSDGSDKIYFRDPQTFEIKRTIRVTLENAPVKAINELEYVNGRIFANVWHQSHVLIIHPSTGVVQGLIDASALIARMPAMKRGNVLNGIAYDPKTEALYLTGKNWPWLFEVEWIGGPD